MEVARIGKPGSCHLLRRTAATLMLEGGADIRFIQDMLGHESLEVTRIYTRVSVAKLAEIHVVTRSRARLARSCCSIKQSKASRVTTCALSLERFAESLWTNPI